MNILLIAVLPIEVENVFDGPEIAGFIVVSGGIFDVVKIELLFTSSCDSGAGIGAGSLVALVTVFPWACFSPQSASTRAASRLSTIDSNSTDSIFCSVMKLVHQSKRGIPANSAGTATAVTMRRSS